MVSPRQDGRTGSWCCAVSLLDRENRRLELISRVRLSATTQGLGLTMEMVRSVIRTRRRSSAALPSAKAIRTRTTCGCPTASSARQHPYCRRMVVRSPRQDPEPFAGGVRIIKTRGGAFDGNTIERELTSMRSSRLPRGSNNLAYPDRLRRRLPFFRSPPSKTRRHGEHIVPASNTTLFLGPQRMLEICPPERRSRQRMLMQVRLRPFRSSAAKTWCWSSASPGRGKRREQVCIYDVE